MSGTVISKNSCATDTETRDIGVAKVLEGIRTGGQKLKGQIEQIRNKFEAEFAITGDLKAAKRAIETLKKALPGVMWCGQFSNREQPAADKLQKHSGLFIGDLDSLGDKLPEIRKKLEASPHVFALFLSPSGDGLKAVFRVPADVSKHAGSLRALAQHVRELTGVQIDQSGSDVSRLCFMSYDPELYHNPNATELVPLPEPEKPKPTFNSNSEVNLSERQRIATEVLGGIDWQTETNGYCACPGKHLHTPGDGGRDCKIELDGAPTVHCFHDHCRGILEGVNHVLRSRIGKAETVDDFPAPIDEAAFYGLADDIVRRIEPHTEADSVALLIQILVAFGNVIGRSPHALADGARHAMNLFAVLVGETSKARKGTAWAHVRRLFKRADEPWAQDCIANGLSSGEGVIWAVRDPITKTVKNKKTGKYEDEISDAGIEDKRLCVVEAEFANVLKVMTREGNTLSPVIRSLWDSGDLRSITKNSPARATGAHGSIIGHITRDELRRLLTETESANGFANCFPMLAVRRSKCLPEGGNIGSDSMNDLVTRLQRAIEFASGVCEVTRSDEARSLWARIYPKLSKGKPGLLGAITARAEAQVLRFSVIYALLDCSSKVEVQHLNAALALWDYCEQSARWIFSKPEETEQRQVVEFIKRWGAPVTVRDVTHNYRPLRGQPEKAEAVLNALVTAGEGEWEPVPTTEKGGRPTRQFRLFEPGVSPEPKPPTNEKGFGSGDSGGQENAVSGELEPVSVAPPEPDVAPQPSDQTPLEKVEI